MNAVIELLKQIKNGNSVTTTTIDKVIIVLNLEEKRSNEMKKQILSLEDKLSESRNTISDLKAGLRTCYNASKGALENNIEGQNHE